jgi:hypothetical protein
VNNQLIQVSFISRNAVFATDVLQYGARSRVPSFGSDVPAVRVPFLPLYNLKEAESCGIKVLSVALMMTVLLF